MTDAPIKGDPKKYADTDWSTNYVRSCWSLL